MSFMNLLWFKSSKKKAAEIGQYSLGRPFCKKAKLTKNIKIGIFHLTEQGPMVMYKDFEELKGITLTNVELSKKIDTLAVNLIAATASGHAYVEGCFDFKLETVNKYRLLVIAISMPNFASQDPRLKNGYYQIVLFIPKEISMNLPSISKMEDQLYLIVRKEINEPSDFTNSKIQKLKNSLITQLDSFLINN